MVLGDHPGALLSAALAARLGLSVLVLPMGPGLGAVVTKSGHCLDPETNFLLGLGRSEDHPGLVSECLHRLGVLHSEADAVLEGEAAFPEIVTPRHRLALRDHEERLKHELRRELGTDGLKAIALLEALEASRPEYERFWLELPARLTLAAGTSKTRISSLNLVELRKRLGRGGLSEAARRWSRAQEVSSFLLEKRHPELEEIFTGLWHSMNTGCQALPNAFALTEAMQMLSLAFTGGAFRGGMSAYREFVLRLARRHGAFIPPKAECRRIFIERGRLAGVQIAQRGNMITVAGGALGCAFDQAKSLMTRSGRSWSGSAQKTPKPIGWKFTLSLTVGEEAIPNGMANRVLWQEKGAPPLEIEWVKPADYGFREAERRLVFVRTLLPFTQESLSPEYQVMAAARMLRQLTELMPFLEYHILRIFPDFRAVPGSPEIPAGEALSDLYGFSVPQMIPENLRCYEGRGMGSRSDVEGLFVVSGEAYPELGSLGGTVAALEAVAWIAHRSGLPGPLA
ncbi:MAG: hypothetical protein NDJ89_09860 [Oligoflexia bacterium]|nr:hypothetical protein [Oligoflexia bacterium]